MLYQRKDIPELHYMMHRHDDNDQYVDYEKKILNSSLSPYIYENDLMSTWLNRMQPLVSLMVDQMNVMKNFKNYMVDKYYYKHNG
jgi:hypothetical protein